MRVETARSATRPTETTVVPIFVTDFDGTLCEHDFYSEVLAQLMPPGTANFYTHYIRGEMTHFECLAAYFAAIPGTEADLIQLVAGMSLPKELPRLLARLRAADWEVVIASAGCRWYIERLLSNAGVTLEVHANDGRWVGHGRGLEMILPKQSPFFSPTVGIDKAAVVRAAQARTNMVAFAGDGHTDVPAARLVPPALRFAVADCAYALTALGESYRSFRNWADIAETLLEES